MATVKMELDMLSIWRCLLVDLMCWGGVVVCVKELGWDYIEIEEDEDEE